VAEDTFIVETWQETAFFAQTAEIAMPAAAAAAAADGLHFM
jgi:hypothetical protein